MPKVLSYVDPVEGFRGWLVYDTDECALSAGGCRVQPGLTQGTLETLAARMTLKQRLLGLNVGGAKCGIDYDPTAPGATEAIRRFFTFLHDEVLERYSMGSDMGTRWPQLEEIARSCGIPSIKYAAARAQRLADGEFFRRIQLMTTGVGALAVHQRRAGAGLAHATLAAARHLGRAPDELTVAVQGFGNLGRGVAATLAEAKVRIVAVADADGALADPDGLDVPTLIAADDRRLIVPPGRGASSSELFGQQADILVLAAGGDAVSEAQAARLPARAVVVGANNGLSPAVEGALHDRSVIVVPDFVGGAGGTASVDVVFGSPQCPSPEQVLDRTGRTIGTLVTRVLERADQDGTSPRTAALGMCAESTYTPGERPYGASPFGDYGRPDKGVAAAAAAPRPAARPLDRPVPDREDCPHERSTVADSTFFRDLFSTEASRETFCDLCKYQRWLDIEAALSLSQAELGIIPQEAARTIADRAVLADLDFALLRREMAASRHSLVGLLRTFQDHCGPAGEWIHYGATTQDIQDTSLALEMRGTLTMLRQQIREMLAPLARLARAHRSTPMVGRTHAQPAVPITFGAKVGSWIDELARAHDRLREAQDRVAVIELFGGAGTMAGYGDRAHELIEKVAARLGLPVPDTAWHATRDRPAEFASALALTAGAFARIADEIRTLSRPEIAELGLAWTPGTVASSTMPHKRNPDLCEQVRVLAGLSASQVTAAFHGLVSEHERDSRGYRLEWAYAPDAAHYALAAARLTLGLVRDLFVRPAQMWQRLHQQAEQVGTERLMLLLTPALGKQAAYSWVYERSQRAQEAGRPLRGQLLLEGDLSALLTTAQIEEALDPLSHLGHAPCLADRMAERAERLLADPEVPASAVLETVG
ncbi:lyase family protein [Streptomyces sp. NPDC048638]|uniref:lyase family protein n=1 Tax=Streptomyces sp. NPDC048638 TaxID=3365580 RepID=UPI0037205394